MSSLGSELLSGTMFASLLLDPERRILEMNPGAARLVEARDGLESRDGCLRAQRSVDDARIGEMLNEVVAGEALEWWGMVERPSGLLPYGVRLTPAGTDAGSARTVAVFVSDPMCRFSISRSALSRIMPLTPAESEITAQLAEGRGIGEISKAIGVAEGTIRVHLRNIFAKLGLKRQADLVRLVLESVACLGRQVADMTGK